MSEIHVVAIATPAPGKEARLREVLSDFTAHVGNHEPDVLRYELFEQYNGNSSNVFVLQEIYKDKATFDAHLGTKFFANLGKLIGDEKLVAVPLDIKTIRPIAGHRSRI